MQAVLLPAVDAAPVHHDGRITRSRRELQMTDERPARERQLDDLERRLEILRRLAEDAQRMAIGGKLPGRRRRRVAPDAAGIEAELEQLGELTRGRSGLGARISFGLVGKPDPAPRLGPMIAVKAGERIHHRRGILRTDALERAEAAGAAQDLGLYLLERTLARAGRLVG
jgi:hypothetical protein